MLIKDPTSIECDFLTMMDNICMAVSVFSFVSLCNRCELSEWRRYSFNDKSREYIPKSSQYGSSPAYMLS